MCLNENLLLTGLFRKKEMKKQTSLFKHRIDSKKLTIMSPRQRSSHIRKRRRLNSDETSHDVDFSTKWRSRDLEDQELARWQSINSSFIEKINNSICRARFQGFVSPKILSRKLVQDAKREHVRSLSPKISNAGMDYEHQSSMQTAASNCKESISRHVKTIIAMSSFWNSDFGKLSITANDQVTSEYLSKIVGRHEKTEVPVMRNKKPFHCLPSMFKKTWLWVEQGKHRSWNQVGREA